MKRLMGYMMSGMLVATVILSGCGGTKEISDGRTIYVSGRYQGNACYWRIKDNVPVRVDLTKDANARFSCANSIFVENNIVYVGGSFNDGEKMTPCYWKENEIPIKLFNDDDGWVNSIFVDHGIVYSVGGCYKISDGIRQCIACYWKGNAPSIDLAKNMDAKAICVSNNKIYIAAANSSGDDLSYYWIINYGDSKKYDIGTASSVRSMFVYNEIVYTAGDSNNRPCYWAGETYKELDTADSWDYATSIYVDKGDIYILSQYGYLWKNGGAPIPKIDNDLSYFKSMCVVKDKIYIAAEKRDRSSGGDFPPNFLFCLILDKNGKVLKKIQLEEKPGQEVTGIFVTES